MRSQLVAALLVLAVAAGAASMASAVFVDDNEMPAGTGPPQLARFAVLVYNLHRNSKLRYVDVSGSQRRRDRGGVRYKMTVTAAGSTGATGQYRAVVWGIPKTYQWMLLEFKHIN